MLIPVPFWLAIALGVIGVIFWVAEQPKKARQRREAQQTRARLRADLADPPPASRLPYGMSDVPADPGGTAPGAATGSAEPGSGTG